MRATALAAMVVGLAACSHPASAPRAPADGPAVAEAPRFIRPDVPTTAEYGPPLDPDAVPPGHGWTCFSMAPSMGCFRAASACEAQRQSFLERAKADGEPSGIDGECFEAERVFAQTVRAISDGTLEVMFWTNATTCAEDGSYYRNQNPYYDQGSGCAELP